MCGSPQLNFALSELNFTLSAYVEKNYEEKGTIFSSAPDMVHPRAHQRS